MTRSQRQVTVGAGRREWLALAVIVLVCTLVSMDISVLFFAAPFLAADLEPSGSQLLWIMDSYAYLLAGLLITMGALGDRYGRRRVLLIGAALFGAMSVLASYSTSPEMLIVARALLGVGGATVAPSTLSLISNMFPDPTQRRTAIGIWTAGFAAGALFGPVVAGVLLEHYWWGSVFLINLPVIALVLAVGPVLLPEFKNPQEARFDLVGAGLSLAAVLPIIYGAKKLAEQDVDTMTGTAIVAGLVFGYLFVLRQRTHAHPILDLALFRSRRFSVAVAVNTILQFSMLGMMMITSQYMLVILHITPFTASLWRLPAILTLVLGLAIGGSLARSVSPATLIGAGLATAAVGFLMMAAVSPDNGLAVMLVGSSVMSVGVGVVVILATDVILATAPPERAGSAAGLAETSNEFGGGLGITILGSVTGALYRIAMTEDVPSALSPEQREVVLATVEGAEKTAQALPAPLGPALSDAAAAAFTTGVQWSTSLGGALLAVIAVLAVVLLRGLPALSPSGDDGAAAPLVEAPPEPASAETPSGGRS
jgi:DHA2 family multidrug resistance protein-like MFS transporter